MTKQEQIQEQEKIAMDLRMKRLNKKAEINSLEKDIEEIERGIKRAEVNIYSLKVLETITP